MNALKVLMWKHWKVRSRRYFLTSFEILFPLVLFLIICNYKDSLDDNEITVKISIKEKKLVEEFNSVVGPESIFYTPVTSATNLLMKKTQERLAYHDIYTNATKKPKITPAINESQLIFSDDIEEDVALVIFENVADTLPEELLYTIKMKNADFKIYPTNGDFVSSKYFENIYESFKKLRWAIDSSYFDILPMDILDQVVTVKYQNSKANMEQEKMISLHFTLLCWMSLLPAFSSLVWGLQEERVNGVQELIKIMGVSKYTHGLSHILNMVPTGFVYTVAVSILTTITFDNLPPILPNTNPLLIFIMLVLHYITIIGLAFCGSYIISGTYEVEALATQFYLMLYMIAQHLMLKEPPDSALLVFGLLPYAPMFWFWDEVVALQQNGLTFANICHVHKGISVLSCYMCLIIQAFLYFGFAWYLAKIRPGPYGQALPWNFFCQKQYWSKKNATPEEQVELQELEERAKCPQYFEPPPKNTKVGIKVVNVSKMFGKNRVLSNVSLDVYKGEITVLLGQNGAGKSTLMSIITGMLKATKGNVYVEGLDIATQRDEIQMVLGLCPQHISFFSYLNVLEQVIFFNLLKGSTFGEARNSSLFLLKQLGINDKSLSMTNKLSSGVKRKLQLACALARDAKVLVLDEPTARLDLKSRRELWNLLLSLRGSHTVLLSTHLIEEADALGDRVAALHAGRLRCHATPMHLKRWLGSGYRLSFTTIGQPGVLAIHATVTSKIPEATVKEISNNSISYNLPYKCSKKFPNLFLLLESKRSAFGIGSIGVTTSTLEDVYLKLCDDVKLSKEAFIGLAKEPTFKILTGPQLYVNQLGILVVRQFKYIFSNKISFIIMPLLSALMIFSMTTLTNNKYAAGDGSRAFKNEYEALRNINIRFMNKTTNCNVIFNRSITDNNLQATENSYANVHVTVAKDGYSVNPEIVQKDKPEYYKYSAGMELHNTKTLVLFSNVCYLKAAFDLMTNIIPTYLLPLVAKEMATNYEFDINNVKPKPVYITIAWAVVVVWVLLITMLKMVSLTNEEYRSGTRRAHMLAGVTPALHWLATLLAHTTVYIVAVVLPMSLMAFLFDRDRTIDNIDFLVAMNVTLTLGMISFLGLIYTTTFKYEKESTVAPLFLMICLCGILAPMHRYITDKLSNYQNEYIWMFGEALSYIFNPLTSFMSAIRCGNIAAHNAAHPLEPKCYYCINNESPGGHMLALIVQSVFNTILVILRDYGVIDAIQDRILLRNYRPSRAVNTDEMVSAEKTYVAKNFDPAKKQIQDAILVNDIHKSYWNYFGNPCNAVKCVSFSVKKGECFGLVGTNGAGKSSTLKVLAGVESLTSGSIYANGGFISKYSTNNVRSLGYCPQSSGLDNFLTAYENLVIPLILRGLALSDVENEVKAWLRIIGLEEYSRRPVSEYSSGCARRLAVAAALCRGGAVTLLDEPTAGVDVAARRRVWAALRRAAPHRALLVTSHSMDEMEALCGRLAIMMGGRVCALGKPAALRAAYSAGHAVMLKLATITATDLTDNSKSDVNHLKAAFHQKFNCTLRDEHKTMLHYHINDTMRYSDLFTELEQLKEEFALLEDYSVTETTLEEVFLSFANNENKEEAMPA